MHGNEPDTRHDPARAQGRPARSAASTCGSCRRTTPTGWPPAPARTPTASTSTATSPTAGRTSTAATSPGPKPASEPETQAMMRFLRDVRPEVHPELPPAAARRGHRHQAPEVRPPGGRRARTCRARRFDCGGVCHGTMTMWFNHQFRGAALTVEYGAHPKRRRLRGTVPRQVLSIFGAGYGTDHVSTPPAVAAHRPSKTGFSLATNAATAAGWSAVAPVQLSSSRSRTPAPPRRSAPAAYATELAHRAERHRRPGREPAGQRRRPRRPARRPAPPWWPGRGSAPPRRGSCWGSRAAPSPWPGRPAAAGGSWRRCRRRAPRWRRRG